MKRDGGLAIPSFVVVLIGCGSKIGAFHGR